VPAEVAASRLAAMIADALGWSDDGQDRVTVFQIEAYPPGRRLAGHETLAGVNAWDGSWLILHPVGVEARASIEPGGPLSLEDLPTEPAFPDALDALDALPALEPPFLNDDTMRAASNLREHTAPLVEPAFDETAIYLPERPPVFPPALPKSWPPAVEPEPPPPPTPSLPPPAELPAARSFDSQPGQVRPPLPPFDPPKVTPRPAQPPGELSPLRGWRQIRVEPPPAGPDQPAEDAPRILPGPVGPLKGWTKLSPSSDPVAPDAPSLKSADASDDDEVTARVGDSAQRRSDAGAP